MYFNLFMITLFLIYYFSHYSFYLSIVKFKKFKQQYPKYDDGLLWFRIFLIIMIILIDLLVFILFLGPLKQFYDSYSGMYVGISITSWGNSNFYLALFFILGLINMFWVLLYYTTYSYHNDGIIKRWYHKDVRGYIFNFPKIKQIYKILGLALLSYFLLSFVQYHFYLDRIDAYLPVDKYRLFPQPPDEYLAKEGVKRLNERYQGKSYDEVFTDIAQDQSITVWLMGGGVDRKPYEFMIAGSDLLRIDNFWGSYTSCYIYPQFHPDGVFSYTKVSCYADHMLSVLP